jgi:8-oxo-dGTP diphosphatase
MRTATEVSAGGVVYRQRNHAIEVILIRVGAKWCLPKGQVEEREALWDTARREVREETGVEGRIEKKLGDVRYWYTRRDANGEVVRVAKRVHFYQVAYLTGSVCNHDHEVDEARWVSVETALRILRFASERELVGKLNDADES